jgi:hypothetical protein
MKKASAAVERAFDRIVFGTNNPEAIYKKLETMEKYLELEGSSLGHSLAGIRHRNYWTYQKAAEKAGVPVEVWKAWESDFATPTHQELQAVLRKLHWAWDLDKFLLLRQQAERLRLKRLTSLQPRMLAAQGVAGVSGTYEWQALGPELQESLKRWGERHQLELPASLIDILADLGSEEEREAWVDEILSGR